MYRGSNGLKWVAKGDKWLDEDSGKQEGSYVGDGAARELYSLPEVRV